LLKKKVKTLNKRFFNFKNDLSIKSILVYLNISEETFYNYNSKNFNFLNFKINQFSSVLNSLDDSLIFINKNLVNLPSDIKGVCIIKTPLKKSSLKNNIIIPSENPKLDYCNLINKFCERKHEKSEMHNINNSLISNTSNIGSNFSIGNFQR